MDGVTRAISKGGGVLVNVQEGGVFQFFGGRMTSHGQCPRGGACECPRVGAFFKLMTSRGQCPRGGCAWCSTHPSSDPPPHLAGWLRACYTHYSRDTNGVFTPEHNNDKTTTRQMLRQMFETGHAPTPPQLGV